MKLFVDTWGWLVLADRKDPRHQATAECYKERGKAAGRIVTSNFVLDEALTLLFRRLPFEQAWSFSAALLESPFLTIEQVTEPRFRRALQLRRTFSDKPAISFTDLSSMVIMADLRIVEVLTGDKHFGQVGMGFRALPE